MQLSRRRTYFKEWRQFRKLTQQQLADKLGTVKSSISKFERGASDYDQSVLESWASVLHCDPEDLISRAPDDEDIRFLFKNAPEDAKNVVIHVLKSHATGREGR